MTKKTHIAVAVAAILPIIIANYSPITFIGLLGATAPDWDMLFGIEHRTITHSFIALLTSSLIVYIFSYNAGLIWLIAYISHLILDSFTKMGVPLLYPFKKKYYGLKLIKTGSSEDLFICLLAIFFICIQYLIN